MIRQNEDFNNLKSHLFVKIWPINLNSQLETKINGSFLKKQNFQFPIL